MRKYLFSDERREQENKKESDVRQKLLLRRFLNTIFVLEERREQEIKNKLEVRQKLTRRRYVSVILFSKER